MASDLVQRLAKSDRLPLCSESIRGVVRLSEDPNATAVQLSDVVTFDPILTARMLRFANNGLFASQKRIVSVREAAVMLGHRAIDVMLLSQVLTAAQQPEELVIACAKLRARSRRRSMAAALIAEALDRNEIAEPASTACLLADSALIALCAVDPELALEVLGISTSDEEGESKSKALLGSQSVVLSAAILDEWNLPPDIIAGVRSISCSSTESAESAEPLSRICLASDRLIRTVQLSVADDAGIDSRLVALTGLDEVQLASIIQSVNAADWLNEEDFLSPPEIEFIRQQAQELLAQLSLAAQFEAHKLALQRDELMRRVTVDWLTGLKNRAAFDESIIAELERARRTHEPLALLMCDLDDFKLVNDTFGHQAGDTVLRDVARSLRQASRRIDIVARYGGEEFAVIAPRCTTRGAQHLAERLRTAVQGTVSRWKGESIRSSLSIGGAVAAWPDSPMTSDQLIASADRQLYAAKRAGKNCCRVEPPVSVRAKAS